MGIWDQDNYPRWTRNGPPGPIGCPNMPFYACVKEGGKNGPLNCAQAPDPSMCTAVTVDGTPPFCGKDDNCKLCAQTYMSACQFERLWHPKLICQPAYLTGLCI